MEIAVSVIWDYIQTNLTDIDAPWQTEEFRRRSYERWAAIEIVNRLMDHPEIHHVTVINDFWVCMEMGAYTCKTTEQRFIFETGMETAENIMMLFI